MTDAEINLAISKIEYPYAVITHDRYNGGSGALIRDNDISLNYADDWSDLNYVNSWADIGPIIEREKITVGFNDTELLYFAHDGYGNNGAFEITPTKAAALCYLKMKEGE